MTTCDLCAGSTVCPECDGVGTTDPDAVDVCTVCAGARACPNCSGAGEVAA